MKAIYSLITIPFAFAAIACGGESKKIDDALSNDLSLASQARQYSPLDSVSTAERQPAQTAAPRRTAAPVRRSPTYSNSPSSSRASQPEYRVQKNTGRDAAIGAGAGAIIGAATSRDKVKGGLIGAAAGGLLGAVIGNNVDKKTVPVKK